MATIKSGVAKARKTTIILSIKYCLGFLDKNGTLGDPTNNIHVAI